MNKKLFYAVLVFALYTCYSPMTWGAEIGRPDIFFVDTTTGGQIILDLDALLGAFSSRARLLNITLVSKDLDEPVAELLYFNRTVELKSKSTHHFMLTSLPKSQHLKSLYVDVEGSFTALPRLHLEESLALKVAKLGVMHKGFEVNTNKSGAVVLEGGKFELRSDSCAHFIKTKAQEVVNFGTINTKTLVGVGDKWLNVRGASIKVAEFFQGKFVQYSDDGLTEAMGLFLLNAELGRMNGVFRARNGLIRFRDNLSVSSNAHLVIENHLTLHSDKNVNFDGKAMVAYQKAWPRIKYPHEILALIRKLSPGLIISAQGSLSKKGSLISHNSSITFVAGANYHGNSGISRAGFFSGNNVEVSAVDAYFNEQVKSFNNIFFKAKNIGIKSAASLWAGEQTVVDSSDTLRNEGEMCAKHHVLKAVRWVDNKSGSIHSEKSLLVDTGFFSNRQGGNISAESAVIYTDHAFINAGANISGQQTEINTPACLNIVSRIEGETSLTVNAGMNGSVAGLYQSNNCTINCLLNLSWRSLVTRSLPSIPRLKDWSYVEMAQNGLRLAKSVSSNVAINTISGISSLFSGARAAGETLYQLVTEPVDSLRPSRVAKKLGQVIQTGSAVYGLYKQTQSFNEYGDENAHEWMRNIGGNATINSVGDFDHGIYFTGINKTNCYNSDFSTGVVWRKTTSTLGGEDHANVWAYESTTSSGGDYIVGGTKHIHNKYSVHAGGNLNITPNATIDSGTAHLSAKGPLTIGKNASVHGLGVAARTQGDVHAHEGSAISGIKVTVASTSDAHLAGMIEGTEAAIILAAKSAKLTSTSHTNGGQIQIESFELNLQPGFRIEGENLALIAHSLPQMHEQAPGAKIESLMTQTGLYSGIKVPKTLMLKTDEHLNFEKSATSASHNFMIDSPAIDVQKDISLVALGTMSIYTANDLKLESGVTIEGRHFVDIYAGENFNPKCRDEKDESKPCKEKITFFRVTIKGGAGSTYNYVDPDTEEGSQRQVGVRIRAKEIKGTALALISTGGDIILEGKRGIKNDGLPVPYVGTHSNHKKGKKLKTWSCKNTAFGSGSYNTPAKVIIRSKEGGYSQQAGEIVTGEGTLICTKDDIAITPLEGQTTRRKIQKAPSITNCGEQKVAIYSEGPIKLLGLCYCGPHGKLDLKGKNIILDRTILAHTSSYQDLRPFIDYSAFSQWKSLKALQSAADLMKALNARDYERGLLSAVNPSLSLGLDRVRSSGKYQSLGEGFIVTKDLSMNAEHTIRQGNGYVIVVHGDTHVEAHDFMQEGASLSSSRTTKSSGTFLSISLKGIELGARTSISRTKSEVWIPATFNVDGTLNLVIKNLSQKAALITAYKISGHIEHLSSETKQDIELTVNAGASASFGLSWAGVPYASGSVNAGVKASRTANHISGIRGGTESTLVVDSADLRGARLTGVQAGSTTYVSLPKEYKNRGTSLGLSTNGTITAGFSNNGHEFAVSVNTKDNMAENSSQLFKTAGTVSYANAENGFSLEVPVVINVSKEAFSKLADDLVGVAHNIAKPQELSLAHDNNSVIDPSDSMASGAAEIDSFSAHDWGDSKVSETPQTENLPITLDSIARNRQKEISENIVLGADTLLSIALAEAIAARLPLEGDSLDTGLVIKAPGTSKSRTFGYRIKGTNIYYQRPEQFSEIVKVLEDLKAAKNNPYAQHSLKAIKKTSGVFFYAAKQTPCEGSSGIYNPKDKSIHIGRNTTDPFCNRTHATIHEGQHAGVPGRKSIPGTKEGLLVAYGKDLSGYQVNRSSILVDLPLEERVAMSKIFDGPWQYFEHIFKTKIAKLNLSDTSISDLLITCEKSILEGEIPKFDGYANAAKLNKAAAAATDTMLEEVAPFFSEASLTNLKQVQEVAPRTHAYMKKHNLEIRWYKTPVAKGLAAAAVAAGDLGFHIALEKKDGLSWPDAIAAGTVKTGIDFAINSPSFAGIAMVCGVPVALAFGGSQVMVSLLPETPIEEINALLEQAHETSVEKDRPFIAREIAAHSYLKMAHDAMTANMLKRMGEMPQEISSKIFESLCDKHPELMPTISRCIKDLWEETKMEPDFP